MSSQTRGSSLPVGTVIPSITCDANPKQTYALYLPSNISPDKKWPIIYVFDPVARGPLAVKTVRAAAEKFGYIVAASNNAHNGPLGGTTEAAQAMWLDTQSKLPIDERRRYTAGMSGGSRVASGVAIGCRDCLAGVIANAAGFPPNSQPARGMKFAYFAAVGDADFNYPEFFELRKKLEEAGARYKIRIFDGVHGWAPPETWLEALDWMDMQAMSAGTLAKDERHIQESFAHRMDRAQQFRAQGNVLEAAREYQSLVRDFSGLTEISAAKAQLAELEKDKALRKAERDEADAVSYQAQLTSDASAQIQKIGTDGLSPMDFAGLRGVLADLKKKVNAAGNAKDSKTLVMRRALAQLFGEAFEAGQTSTDLKKYDEALQYFDLAAAGAPYPQWSYYRRAVVYALKGDKKGVIASLKQAVDAGLSDASVLEADEFKAYRELPDFQGLVSELKEKK
jgi:tetratricopeptide (TPR) repeat protein